MYPEERLVGKSKQRSTAIQLKKPYFCNEAMHRGNSPEWRLESGSASVLYEHIIVVDEARGECYGRAKYPDQPDQFKGDESWPET
jgi:hypothetical protein